VAGDRDGRERRAEGPGPEVWLERWMAAQREAIGGYREVLERMGQSFQMGSYTPSSWLEDVFSLWSVGLRAAGAAWTGPRSGVTSADPERVAVVQVPRGVEAWQFSVDLDTRPLAGLGRVELSTPGFAPASGGFSIEHPRNVAFDPGFLDVGRAGTATVQVALFSLPRALHPGCYSGPVQARPIGGGSPTTLAEVHVHVMERAGPPPQHPAESERGAS
jgi:hypothetical protein